MKIQIFGHFCFLIFGQYISIWYYKPNRYLTSTKYLLFSLSLVPTTNNIKNCPHPVTTFRKSHLGFSIPPLSPGNPTPFSLQPSYFAFWHFPFLCVLALLLLAPVILQKNLTLVTFGHTLKIQQSSPVCTCVVKNMYIEEKEGRVKLWREILPCCWVNFLK